MKFKIKDLEIEISKELLLTQIKESILPITLGISFISLDYNIGDYQFWCYLLAFVVGIYFTMDCADERYDKYHKKEYDRKLKERYEKAISEIDLTIYKTDKVNSESIVSFHFPEWTLMSEERQEEYVEMFKKKFKGYNILITCGSLKMKIDNRLSTKLNFKKSLEEEIEEQRINYRNNTNSTKHFLDEEC